MEKLLKTTPPKRQKTPKIRWGSGKKGGGVWYLFGRFYRLETTPLPYREGQNEEANRLEVPTPAKIGE